jgi:hypothetical protein
MTGCLGLKPREADKERMDRTALGVSTTDGNDVEGKSVTETLQIKRWRIPEPPDFEVDVDVIVMMLTGYRAWDGEL